MKKILKNLVKLIFKKFGFKISCYSENYNSKKASKKTNKLSYYETATGNFFLPTDANNDIVANTIIANRIFEKDVVDIAAKYIKPNSVVLDIGANFGQMSILFSNLVGENGKVFSFDADDWVFEILKKNIEANNKIGKIIPFFGAVYNISNEILIFPNQDFKEFGSYGSYGIDFNAVENGDGRKVQTVTIDGIEIEQPISFMKIDIQGGDLQAMQGAVKTIGKNKMPILFEYEYHFEDRFNFSFQQYVDFVQSIDYKFEKVINGHNFLIVPR
jgi:FkbM family methyltransferase